MPALPHDTGNPPAEQPERSENTWRHVSDEAAKVVAKAQERAARKERAE